MKQKSTFFLAMSGLSFLLFGLLTTLVLLVDVRPALFGRFHWQVSC